MIYRWLIEVSKGPYYFAGFRDGKPIASAAVSEALRYPSQYIAENAIYGYGLPDSAWAVEHAFEDDSK